MRYPVLAGLTADPTMNACSINWNYSNDWTYDTLEWGGTTSYGNVVATNCTTMVHMVNVVGLTPGTAYHFRIKSRDITGNNIISPDYIFTTDSLSFTSYSISEVTNSSAMVRWTLNQSTEEATVKYGLDPQCSFTALDDESSAGITGLTPGQKYFVLIEAVNGTDTVRSPVLSFRTIGRSLFADSTGHLTKIIDQSGETVYGYDDLGRTVTRRVKYNDFAAKYYFFYYNYDDAGNITSAAYPDGAVNTYNYDQYNNLTSLYRDNNLIKQFSYTAAGACSTEAYPNGVNGIYSYHPRLWLKNASITKGTSKYFKHTYNYDGIGDLLSDIDSTGLSSSINRFYCYDELKRLNGEEASTNILTSISPSISYDPMGNRTLAGTTSYQYYTGTNRLERENFADATTKHYSYDANGNMNNDSVWAYTYDYRNKLTKMTKFVTSGSSTIEYLYNHAGLRVKDKKTDVVVKTKLPNIREQSVSVPDPYNDLVAGAPSGDGHDDARDLGKLEVYNDDDFLYFTIAHKYLYGAWQGDYQHLYIAVDTDGEFGLGSTRLPDGIEARIPADHAWEYCAYIYGGNDYGLYIGEGFKQKNLFTADGRKMEVTLGTGANAKALVKIPLELLGNPQNISFTVISAIPPSPIGGGTQGGVLSSRVCDVLPGDRLAVDGGLITTHHAFPITITKVTYITTIKTNYNLYDDGGQVLCDLDLNGNITKKYVYAGGKHVAMEMPGNKDYMVNGGFEYGDCVAPLTPWWKWAPDNQTPSVNWTIVSDVKRSGTYSARADAFSATVYECYVQHLSLPALPFLASCYVKAQDLTGGLYVVVEFWNADYTTGLGSITSNLQTGTFDWRLVSVPVTSVPVGTGAIKVNIMRMAGAGTVWVDDARCEEGVSRKEDANYYYHCDYLGSPRAMTMLPVRVPGGRIIMLLAPIMVQ